jgi:hypothetical protein
MNKALFDAEVARCRRGADQAELWWRAIDKCHAAGAVWEEAVARLRCAEATLTGGLPASAVGDYAAAEPAVEHRFRTAGGREVLHCLDAGTARLWEAA